jgi:hypothetical protein
VDLGTIRFLRIVLEENARRRKVMRWLLLALRMAAVVLLVGLFARPYFSVAASGGDKELIVILIDQSATMLLKGERGRLIDQAVSEAKKLVQSAGAETRFELAFFDHQIHPLTETDDSKGSKGQAVLDRLQVPAISYGATNYGIAIAWARDVVVKAPPGRKQLHLFTDLQRSGLDWTEVEALPAEVKSHLHDLGNSVVNNVAVTEIRTPRLWIRPGESPALKASIQHGGSFSLDEVPILLEVGKLPERLPASSKSGKELPNPQMVDFAKLSGRITRRERVKLEPGATVTLDFEMPALDEGLWQGRVVVEYDDDLSFDNQRFFAISATPAYQVLILNGGENGSSITSETYYVETALRLAPPGESYSESPFQPTVVPFNDATSLPDLTSYAAVVLADVAKVTAGSTQSLTNVGLNCGKIGDPRVTVDLPWRLTKWNLTHPVMQPFSDPQHGDLRRLIFAAYSHVACSPDVEVLASFNTGDPAIIERKVGEGSAIWVTVSCGRDWSDWSRSRLFLPLLHQLLGYEVGLTQGGRVRTRVIDNEQKTSLPGDISPEAELQAAATLKSTDAKLFSNRSVPAVYQFERFGEVVNTSPRESDVERCTRQEFEDRFAVKFEDEEGPSVRAGSDAGHVDFQRDEVWPWVASALLMVLLLEGFVGNRTTA